MMPWLVALRLWAKLTKAWVQTMPPQESNVLVIGKDVEVEDEDVLEPVQR